jgi:cell division protein FtsZ
MTSIKIVGVGGAGINILNRLMKSGLCDVEFIAADRDPDALERSKAPNKIDLKGTPYCQDFFKIGNPGDDDELQLRLFGKSKYDRIMEPLAGNQDIERVLDTDVLVIVAGLGGLTGSEVAPAITEMAKKKGVLTYAVVSKPFCFEIDGAREMAEQAIKIICSETRWLYKTITELWPERIEESYHLRTASLFAFSCEQIVQMYARQQFKDSAKYRLVDRVLSQEILHIVNFIKQGLSHDGLNNNNTREVSQTIIHGKN